MQMHKIKLKLDKILRHLIDASEYISGIVQKILISFLVT